MKKARDSGQDIDDEQSIPVSVVGKFYPAHSR